MRHAHRNTHNTEWLMLKKTQPRCRGWAETPPIRPRNFHRIAIHTQCGGVAAAGARHRTPRPASDLRNQKRRGQEGEPHLPSASPWPSPASASPSEPSDWGREGRKGARASLPGGPQHTGWEGRDHRASTRAKNCAGGPGGEGAAGNNNKPHTTGAASASPSASSTPRRLCIGEQGSGWGKSFGVTTRPAPKTVRDVSRRWEHAVPCDTIVMKRNSTFPFS